MVVRQEGSGPQASGHSASPPSSHLPQVGLGASHLLPPVGSTSVAHLKPSSTAVSTPPTTTTPPSTWSTSWPAPTCTMAPKALAACSPGAADQERGLRGDQE